MPGLDSPMFALLCWTRKRQFITLLTEKTLKWATAVWDQWEKIRLPFSIFLNFLNEFLTMLFRTLAAGSGWNEPALKGAFHRGLNKEILTKLTCLDEKASLDELINTIHLDALMFQKGGKIESFVLAETNEYEPMQLGRMRVSENERLHWRKEQLCYYYYYLMTGH